MIKYGFQFFASKVSYILSIILKMLKSPDNLFSMLSRSSGLLYGPIHLFITHAWTIVNIHWISLRSKRTQLPGQSADMRGEKRFLISLVEIDTNKSIEFPNKNRNRKFMPGEEKGLVTCSFYFILFL